MVILVALVAAVACPASLGASCLDELPDWVRNRRTDSMTYLFELGAATDAASYEEAEAGALESALDALAGRVASSLPPGASEHPTVDSGQFLDFERVPGGEHVCEEGGKHSAWILIRYPSSGFEEVVRRYSRPRRLWLSAETAFLDADHEADPVERAALVSGGRDSLRALVAEYPVGQQTYFDTERALFLLAERALRADNPCQAVMYYRRIEKHSSGHAWQTRVIHQLDRVECGDEEWRRFVLAGRFCSKPVTLRCCLDLNGSESTYADLAASISRMLSSVGAVPRIVDCGVEPGSVQDPDADTEGPDGELVVDVEVALAGDTVNLESGGTAYRVQGEVRTLASAGGTEFFRDSFPVVASNQHGRQVCVYTLAVKIEESIGEHLVESLQGGE